MPPAPARTHACTHKTIRTPVPIAPPSFTLSTLTVHCTSTMQVREAVLQWTEGSQPVTTLPHFFSFFFFSFCFWFVPSARGLRGRRAACRAPSRRLAPFFYADERSTLMSSLHSKASRITRRLRCNARAAAHLCVLMLHQKGHLRPRGVHRRIVTVAHCAARWQVRTSGFFGCFSFFFLEKTMLSSEF